MHHLDIINHSKCEKSTIITDASNKGRKSSLFALSDIRCKIINPTSKSYLYKYIPPLRYCMDVKLLVIQTYLEQSDSLFEKLQFTFKIRKLDMYESLFHVYNRDLGNCHLKFLILKDYYKWTCKICFSDLINAIHT